jgi:hypothetical protein
VKGKIVLDDIQQSSQLLVFPKGDIVKKVSVVMLAVTLLTSIFSVGDSVLNPLPSHALCLQPEE